MLAITPDRAAEAIATRPDVVVFYLDDWAPYPARIWNQEDRTPELARFAERGLVFRNAIASTPLCGPSRANLLTGRYGHNAGVTENTVGRYDGAEPVAEALRGAGYHTAFVGKHLNGLTHEYPTRRRMDELAEHWDRFDVIWHDQGRYYDWRQYRKGGVHRYGHAPADHSSFQAARRAVSFIEATPRDEPLFLVVSLVDGHLPRTPMARFVGDAACRGISPWRGPAYQEKDVSDKPAYVRRVARRGTSGYDLRTRCEEALTVDWVVGQVRRALRATGRANGTLQVLTADNGMLMGDHRLVGKTYPYDTWVPLFMRWPAMLRGQRREVREPVSNVDLGATFCELAGCALPATDGTSLLPLVLGRSDRLDRSFVYSEMLHGGSRSGRLSQARPAWIQIHSTLGYSDRLWAYTRYDTGEEELYDITADPHRLKNLVGRSRTKRVRADLEAFWKETKDRDDVRWRGGLP
jgi:arylsulfatase A-like enzyme